MARADALVVGAWTKGYFIITQHPSEGALRFLEKLSLNGKPVAVFATYKLAIGSTLTQLANAVEASGGQVTGMYKVKGPHVPEGFDGWVASLARLDTASTGDDRRHAVHEPCGAWSGRASATLPAGRAARPTMDGRPRA